MGKQKYIELNKFIIMSKYVELECNGRNNARILEDVFEALIGAMYVEFSRKNKGCGYNTVYDFIVNIIENKIDMVDLVKIDNNFKDQLMRYYQKQFNGKYPIYFEDTKNQKIYNQLLIKEYQSNFISFMLLTYNKLHLPREIYYLIFEMLNI